MFQGVGNRTFLRPSNALKMTIPDLVRKCKRDTLPPLSVPRPRYFSSSVSLFTPSSWFERKYSLPYRDIATNGFSLRYLLHNDPFPVKRGVHLLQTFRGKKTPTISGFFPSDQLSPNTSLVLSSPHSMYLTTI